MTPDEAKAQLDQNVREIINWHFSPETGCPFWLEWAGKNFDPRKEIKCYEDIVTKFPRFEDEWLRDLQPDVWVPAAFKGKAYNIFETGGTTGMQKQRIGWNDFRVDYEEFSHKLDDKHFPPGVAWIMVGPTGPRSLRLAVEHLANYRGSSCYFIDLDPRFVKKLIGNRQFDVVRQYMEHVVDQAVMILYHRKIACLFTTPKLLEAIGEKINVYVTGISGCFCGGTTTTTSNVRLPWKTLENQWFTLRRTISQLRAKWFHHCGCLQVGHFASPNSLLAYVAQPVPFAF